VTIRNLYAEPPYKQAVLQRDGTVSLGWLSWFNAIARVGRVLVYDVPFDLPSIAGGARSTVTATVKGARLGDFAQASITPTDPALSITAQITATDTASIIFHNVSGSAVDLAAGTLRVRVEQV
jgi:hypothetical protein